MSKKKKKLRTKKKKIDDLLLDFTKDLEFESKSTDNVSELFGGKLLNEDNSHNNFSKSFSELSPVNEKEYPTESIHFSNPANPRALNISNSKQTVTKTEAKSTNLNLNGSQTVNTFSDNIKDKTLNGKHSVNKKNKLNLPLDKNSKQSVNNINTFNSEINQKDLKQEAKESDDNLKKPTISKQSVNNKENQSTNPNFNSKQTVNKIEAKSTNQNLNGSQTVNTFSDNIEDKTLNGKHSVNTQNKGSSFKTISNRKQTVNDESSSSLFLNSKHSVINQETNGEHLEAKTVNKRKTKGEPNSKRTRKPNGKQKEFPWPYSRLSGTSKKIIDYVFIELERTREVMTRPIRTDELSAYCSTTKKSLKTVIKRCVVQKGVLEIPESFDGKSGYRRFSLPKHILEEIRLINYVKQETKRETKRETIEKTNSSSTYVRSSLNKRELSRQEKEQDDIQAGKLLKFAPECLIDSGFDLIHVKQMQSYGLSDEDIKSSFENFGFDVEKGLITIRSGARAYFLSAVQKDKGYASGFMADYIKKEVEAHQAQRQAIEEAKRQMQLMQKEEEITKKYLEWKNERTDMEILSELPESFQRLGHTNQKNLSNFIRAYFEGNILDKM